MQQFWDWVQSKLPALARVQDPDDPLWDEALAQLKQVHPDLWFEMGERPDGVRDLVITAEGKSELFPIVDALIARAPVVCGWEFVALKPPMGFDFATTYEGIRFDPGEIWFHPLTSASHPDDLGLCVGIPGLTAAATRQSENAVLVILDTALGERQAATAIDHVEVIALPEAPEAAGYIPLPSLPRYLDWRRQKLERL